MKPAHHLRQSLMLLVAACGLCACTPGAQDRALPDASAPVLVQEVAASIFGIEYDWHRNILYVAEAGPQARTEPSRILQLDPQTLAVETAIDLPESVFDLVLGGDGSRLYAIHTTDHAFSVIDPVSGTVTKTITLTRERTPEDKDSIIVIRKIAVDERNGRLFLAETTWPRGALFVVNAHTLEVEKILPDIGLFAMGTALDSAGHRLFIGNMDHEIIVLDTRSLEIVQRWNVNVDQPLSLAYDAQRELVYISDQGREYWTEFMATHAPHYRPLGAGHKVVVINAKNGEQVREIKTGEGPLELLLNEDGTRLFVTLREDGALAVYDTASGQPVRSVPLPVHPNSMALDVQGQRLFVTVKEPIENETRPERVARIRLAD